MSQTPRILFRPAADADANFILNSYLKSARASWPCVTSAVFYREAKARFETLVTRPDAALRIAADPLDANVIWGWALTEPDVVHYLYVKHSLRRFGITRALLAQAGVLPGFEASHLTDAAKRVATSHPGLFTYNPWRS